MSGFVGDLSPDQEKFLLEIKRKLKENNDSIVLEEKAKLDDSMILRFCRARKWNLNDAYTMLFNALLFRATFQNTGVDAITEETVDNEMKAGKSFFHGSDKEGRPVCIVRTRKHDSSQRDLEEAQRYCVYVMETGKALLPPGIETCTLIFDMSSFSTKNMDYPLVKFMVDMFQKYYPESLARCLILNAPWVFMGVWNIIKHWLDPYTVSKISFVKTRQLIDYIPADQLLMAYGGESKFKYTYKGTVVED
ncbi:cellular retinaldehyde-binding/triple function domain-containing protein [Heterostelium album PN500]|uniref:Cellular retinaldehyde-binding/triple function domain-containing protein n=1 Tax=Heterostelium pallidum (strain ATCC 26659 / Pp 5 / PN500) TaxID=670386 RepID=D3B8B1_HETP5|nr:cellular retinaldehyde-binding/triple function domain-containing protein [Heterostelium album PN500]EFA82279.1 cellular retinaldehyde-binding/triple function domain-containing protein [Heterostelium album PN500]|eukprot:XP_020434396.1 cellular retinaldehyde-binding/triple function domain-containing protein [Heterostelium album PN500]